MANRKKTIRNYYPIALNLGKKPALVAGGGRVALTKVKSLLQFKAKVNLIAPRANIELKQLANEGKLRWIKRKIRPSDLKYYEIIIAATSDSRINKMISFFSKKNKAKVNVVDRPALSDFISPAILRVGIAIIAVYTNARNPVLSRDLKNYLKENWRDFLSYRNKIRKP